LTRVYGGQELSLPAILAPIIIMFIYIFAIILIFIEEIQHRASTVIQVLGRLTALRRCMKIISRMLSINTWYLITSIYLSPLAVLLAIYHLLYDTISALALSYASLIVYVAFKSPELAYKIPLIIIAFILIPLTLYLKFIGTLLTIIITLTIGLKVKTSPATSVSPLT
ncbi:MAG: hypothetical protein DRN04_17665, partial [Thermoprotei archaeon]